MADPRPEHELRVPDDEDHVMRDDHEEAELEEDRQQQGRFGLTGTLQRAMIAYLPRKTRSMPNVHNQSNQLKILLLESFR